ncbi:MAG TPA: NAD(P)-binding domain-containing protein [Vicinamibacterales bacterium]|jgi:putative flavoprotein involved in K+ transport|nr:NAD(P)-binding domain-containing protein [Vicinamibacterales bacterium]
MQIDSGTTTRIDTVVVGAGQAGLSVGYHLARRGVSFVILDGNARIGDQWRRRWDSLRLFTPARFDGLDGLPFPAPSDAFPTKNEMADYLEEYARHFELPVLTGTRVGRLSRQGDGFLVVAGGRRFEADNVVVAMGNFQRPRIPAFAGELDRAIVQLHSFDYRSPDQLQPGPVLVAGAGNSGSELAREMASAGHETWMVGRDTGHVPFRIAGFAGRTLLVRLVLRGLFHRVLTIATPIGRRVRPKILHGGGPLIRVRRTDLTRLGVRLGPKVTASRNGLPMLEDGRVLDVKNVIWCTGFHPGFSWIDLPVFDAYGEPRHEGGVVPGETGLYFVGLHFLYAFSSEMIHGVGRDADRIAGLVAARYHQRQSAAPAVGSTPSVAPLAWR